MSTAENAPAKPRGIVRITYTHDAMIDLIIQEPTVTHAELGQLFEKSPAWIARIVGSDAFKARLAERKAELVDPVLARSLNDRLRTVTTKALDIISEKLDAPEAGAQYALEALGIATSSMVRSVK